MKLTRNGETFTGNFSNKFITTNGFTGTVCNKKAAKSIYQKGGKKKKITRKRLRKKIQRRSFFNLKRRITGGYIYSKKNNYNKKLKEKHHTFKKNRSKNNNKKNNYMMSGGLKALDFAKLPNQHKTPKIVNGTSSHYEISMKSGKGGLMTNPPSIKKVIQ